MQIPAIDMIKNYIEDEIIGKMVEYANVVQ